MRVWMMRVSNFPQFLSPLFLTLLASSLCFAAQSNRISAPIDSSQVVTLPGRVHPLAQAQYDQGRVEPTFQLGYVTLLFSPSASQMKALDHLIAQQQNPASRNFHKWLTPEQFADGFALTANDMQKVTAWLRTQGFQIVSVARGRQFVVFTGTEALLESAFRTEIHRYNVNGQMHFANAVMPSIPAALSGVAVGFRGLNDFVPRPSLRQHPDYTLTGATTHFLAPGDLATIYDIAALHTNGFDGTGQKIVIVGQSDVYIDDINFYRTDFGLSSVSGCGGAGCNTPNLRYIEATTPAPGYQAGDLGESDLDLEIAGAVAPNAQLIFVTSNANSGGVTFSAQYAIDNMLAPVISMSYGQCEFDSADSTDPLSTQDLVFKQAVAQGISFFAASGDDGPAICDINDNTTGAPVSSAIMGLSVSYPASSQYVTGVGGTEFNEGSGTYWNATNDSPDGDSAKSYIPEKSWNDFFVLSPHSLDGGGGGPSNCANENAGFTECVSGFPKPSWQTGAGVPADGVRDVPDVSLSASNVNDPYIVCVPLSEVGKTGSTSSCATSISNALQVNNSAFGGTSASTPVMAGIAVLLNQYLNGSSAAGLGLINPMLYSLAANSPTAFHDIPAGSNSIVDCTVGTPSTQPVALQCPASGTFGYSTTTGYDYVTGLGSVDANNLASAWKATLAPDFQFSPAPTPVSVSAGQSVASTVTITAIAGSTPTVVNFSPSSCKGQPAGSTCSFNPTSVIFDGINPVTTTLTISTLANMALPTGAQTITITPTSPSNVSTTVSLTVTATTETFSLSSTASTFPVSPGGTASISITVNSSNGFITGSGSAAATALPVTYSVSGIPTTAEISHLFSPAGGVSVTQTAVTLNLGTTAPTAQLRPPFGRTGGIFFALLLPGLFGIIFLGGSRPRSLRLLSLIVVLGFSTLWMSACGGSNSSSKSPGTPAGSYTVTVTATTGGANPITNSGKPLTITLTVN
jgi:subtilase family serine protease